MAKSGIHQTAGIAMAIVSVLTADHIQRWSQSELKENQRVRRGKRLVMH